MISELEKIGVSDVTLFKTEYSRIEALKIELKSKAMSKAVKQAEAILLPLNLPLGKAIHIIDEYADTESQHADRLLRSNVAGIAIRGNSFLKDPVEGFMVDFEKIKVTSRLLVKFEIAQ